MRAKLYKKIDDKHIRYYFINLFPTLFGEYVVERVYGSIFNRSPTGIKKDYFNDFSKAKMFFEKVLFKKRKRGYNEHINPTV